jgi:hypothetical protein
MTPVNASDLRRRSNVAKIRRIAADRVPRSANPLSGGRHQQSPHVIKVYLSGVSIPHFIGEPDSRTRSPIGLHQICDVNQRDRSDSLKRD